MKKYFDLKILNISFWLALILAYIVPSKELQIYGYPFKF